MGESDLDTILVSGRHHGCFDPFTFPSFFFFGGLSIPLSQAILAHVFSYNITWSATVKEVERSNFFKEIPKIIKRSGIVTLSLTPV